MAANDAYLALARTTRAERLGSALLDCAPRAPYLAGGNHLDALRAALARAVTTRSVTRLLLDDDRSPNSGLPASTAKPLHSRWALINIPIVSDEGVLRYLLHRAEASGSGEHEAADERVRVLSQMLGERTRELESAVGALEAFTYSVSHDLRAPLRAIDGFAQALDQDYAAVLDAGAQHYLERVRAGAQRMSELLDDMLELSRLQCLPLRPSRLDMSELCRRIAHELAQKYPGREVEVVIEPGLSVYADAHLARVALEKLLDNAWKFTSKQSAAQIQIGSEPGDEGPTLFVADNGVGFDMASASRLFSPFQRLHKQTEFEGTGCGLAAVQRIVLRHGGRIWAEAAAGKGAKFRLYFGVAGD